jgi:hypothetical protein
MPITACRVAIGAAPVENVWELLVDSTLYDTRWDMHTERIVPEGPITPGQVLYGTTAALDRKWAVRGVVEAEYAAGWRAAAHVAQHGP